MAAIPLPTRVATMSEGMTRYYHGDHLGSTNLVTDELSEVKQLKEYQPFGAFARQESYGSVEDHINFYFNNKFFEENVGLYYYEARYYDPR